MTQRTITGGIFVSILIGAILFSAYSFSLLFFGITIIGLWEFYILSIKTGHDPQKIMGILIGALIFTGNTLNFSSTFRQYTFIPLALLLPAIFSVFIIELYRKKDKPFGNIAFTFVGIIYIVLPFSLLSMIAFQDAWWIGSYIYNPHKIAGILFILWASDTGAYLSGKAFGKHKLFERISPGKTWEGTIGGGILSLAIAYVVSLFYKELTVIDWMIISLIIVVIGNFGDLVESLFKRSIDAKDSGTILPGHGGILDRFDSLILSTPFIFMYLIFTNKL